MITDESMGGQLMRVIDLLPHDLHQWCWFKPRDSPQWLKVLESYLWPGVSCLNFLESYLWPWVSWVKSWYFFELSLHYMPKSHSNCWRPWNEVCFMRKKEQVDEKNSTVGIFCTYWIFFLFLVFNATFSNISAMSWWPVLVVEEAGVPEENHRPWASNW